MSRFLSLFFVTFAFFRGDVSPILLDNYRLKKTIEASRNCFMYFLILSLVSIFLVWMSLEIKPARDGGTNYLAAFIGFVGILGISVAFVIFAKIFLDHGFACFFPTIRFLRACRRLENIISRASKLNFSDLKTAADEKMAYSGMSLLKWVESIHSLSHEDVACKIRIIKRIDAEMENRQKVFSDFGLANSIDSYYQKGRQLIVDQARSELVHAPSEDS